MTKITFEPESNILFERVSNIIESARMTVVRTTNRTMVATYFLIGKQIVEHKQGGKEKAAYAKKIIENLSQKLTDYYGSGYSVRYLEQMRKFYIIYGLRIPQTNFAEFEKVCQNFDLSWSHYLVLLRIKNEQERQFYEIESNKNFWNLDELKRQLNSSLFERLLISTDKNKVHELATKGQIVKKAQDLMKDPLVLEFLGLEDKAAYSENELETAIINQIENFMLELGKGFFFGGRQVRFTFDEKHFKVDLVFYNRILQCFVLIDLKIGELTHQDLGQMQMYINFYDRFQKTETENPTIGIIICKDKSDAIVEITLPANNQQIFASQYQLYLPTKEQIRKLLENKDENLL